MPVLSVPDVRVIKPVHVNVETAVGVHVHVGDEKCAISRLIATAL